MKNIDIQKYFEKEKLTKNDLKEIKVILDECCHIYYNTSETSPLTDEEFDKLLKLFNKYVKYSTTTAPASGKRLIDVSHLYPELVGTLDKANSMEDVKEWFDSKIPDGDTIYEVAVSYKEDGNSIAGTFDKNKKLNQALTRGKEGKGVDMTKFFRHVRAELPNKNSEFGIKFEAVMTNEDFEEYNEIYYTLNGRYLANSRSAVAGILGSDEGYKYTHFIKLVPLAIKFKDMEVSRKDQLRMTEFLSKQTDFLELEYRIIKGTKSEIIEQIDKWYQKIINEKRDKLNRPIDGIVIEFLDENLRKKLGRDDDRNKFDLALKFPYLVKKSKVLDIEFYMGKTNRITPVVVFEDVVFNGATCNHVSIANYKRFKELKLKKGDTIVVEYRNDVLSYIPENLDRDKEGELIPFLKKCPCCGGKLTLNANKTFVNCKNKECPNMVLGKCVNWLIKLGIKGVKENTLEKIITNCNIKIIPDLYALQEDDLLQIDGFKEKSSKAIIKAINSRTQIYDWELVGSLNIEGFGRKNAKLLCKAYDLKELYTFIKNKTFKDKVVELEGFSDISANNIEKGLIENFETVRAMRKILTVKSTKVDPNKVQSQGYKIVFTGFRDKDLQQKLEDLGHSVTTSVSKNTDIVITKDPNGSSSKLVKARELGKLILSPDQLKSKLNI